MPGNCRAMHSKILLDIRCYIHILLWLAGWWKREGWRWGVDEGTGDARWWFPKRISAETTRRDEKTIQGMCQFYYGEHSQTLISIWSWNLKMLFIKFSFLLLWTFELMWNFIMSKLRIIDSISEISFNFLLLTLSLANQRSERKFWWRLS